MTTAEQRTAWFGGILPTSFVLLRKVRAWFLAFPFLSPIQE